MMEFGEEGRMDIRGVGVLDGKAVIQLDMYGTNITDVTVRRWTGDAYELRTKLDLLIKEMEQKAGISSIDREDELLRQTKAKLSYNVGQLAAQLQQEGKISHEQVGIWLGRINNGEEAAVALEAAAIAEGGKA